MYPRVPKKLLKGLEHGIIKNIVKLYTMFLHLEKNNFNIYSYSIFLDTGIVNVKKEKIIEMLLKNRSVTTVTGSFIKNGKGGVIHISYNKNLKNIKYPSIEVVIEEINC